MRQPSPDGLGSTCRRRRRSTPAFKAAWAARRSLGKPAPPLPGQQTIPKDGTPMYSKATLLCVSAEAAAAVVAGADRPGDQNHTVTKTADKVVIAYLDRRYPLDIVLWACLRGHVTDDQAEPFINDLTGHNEKKTDHR
ncbi:hypothetical protein [Streptomyces sp. NPDC005385]|uniref:hypothetical protein n=1 Tax=Streptomyces sp. NPDC005385 TaxID=3157039 RepID=UPI0033B2FC34